MLKRSTLRFFIESLEVILDGVIAAVHETALFLREFLSMGGWIFFIGPGNDFYIFDFFRVNERPERFS